MKTTTAFDWESFESTYGSARDVPTALRAACETKDPIDARYQVLAVVHHACDLGALNEAAPYFIALTLDHAAKRACRSLQPWPLLQGTLQILEGRVFYGHEFGFGPHRTPCPFQSTLSEHESLRFNLRQELLVAQVDAAIRSGRDLLRAMLCDGSPEDRATAGVFAVLSGCGAALGEHMLRAFTDERAPRAWASLAISCSAVSPPLLAASDERLLRGLEASEPAVRIGAATATLRLTRGSNELSKELALAVRGGLCHCDPLSFWERDDCGHDFVWFDEHLGGELARALYESSLPKVQKNELFRVALSATPEPDAEAEHSPASIACWFLLRENLSRHYLRDSVMSYEDLSTDEREVLRWLSEERTWILNGGENVRSFGIENFLDTVTDLIEGPPSYLQKTQRGRWGERQVSWSRWKWLRATLDHHVQRKTAQEWALRRMLRECGAEELLQIFCFAIGREWIPSETFLKVLIELYAEGWNLSGPTPAGPGLDAQPVLQHELDKFHCVVGALQDTNRDPMAEWNESLPESLRDELRRAIESRRIIIDTEYSATRR